MASNRKLLGSMALAALMVGGYTTYWAPGPDAQGTFELMPRMVASPFLVEHAAEF
jgi:hypothetical protein